jgi:Protein phosphatase 2C
MASSPRDGCSRRWRIVGRSVAGASHLRRKLPNQDALGWWPEAGDGPLGILAIADGHGSWYSPRSDVGSRLAVATAVAVLREVVERPGGRAGEELAAEIVRRWQGAVLADVGQRPLPEEFPGPLLAYGSTLLAAAATREALLLLQVGDGDVLLVAEDGTVSRPVPADPRLIANATTSLSAADAAADFRTARVPLTEAAPALVLMSSDGYANSFRDDAGFRQVGSDLLALIRAEGLAAVEANLEAWLQEASEQGSGDDVTLGLLYRDGDSASRA